MLAFPTGPVGEQRASHQWAPIASDDHRSLCDMLSKQCADAALVCSGQEKPILGLWCYLTITDKVDLALGVQYLPASAFNTHPNFYSWHHAQEFWSSFCFVCMSVAVSRIFHFSYFSSLASRSTKAPSPSVFVSSLLPSILRHGVICQ
jgi:hypothetical protein